MAKQKLPHMPLFTADIEVDEDCSLMDLDEYGAYVRLLSRQWIEGSIPADPSKLAKLIRATPEQMADIWAVVRNKFAPGGEGRLINHRLAEERRIVLDKIKARSEAGSLGGRPRGKQTDKQNESKLKAKPIIRASDYDYESSGESDSDASTIPDDSAPSLRPNPAGELPQSVVDAAVRAFNLWCGRDTGMELNATRNDHGFVGGFVSEITETPPIIRHGQQVSRALLIPQAVEALMGKAGGPRFTAIKYAISCVRNQLQEWATNGIGKPADKPKPTGPAIPAGIAESVKRIGARPWTPPPSKEVA